jgi:DNA-binding transcriptional ArsR family regulator
MNLNEAMVSESSKIFSALGDPSRLRILQVLLSADAPMHQGALALASGLSQANASKHLLQLARVGLVVKERQGNLMLFSPAGPLVTGLCDLVCDHVTKRIQHAYSSVN